MSAPGPPTAPPTVLPTVPSVRVRDLRVGYRTARGPLWAVDGADFEVWPGESLGLVGESGCGKSSLGRALLQLMPPGGVVRGSVELAARSSSSEAVGHPIRSSSSEAVGHPIRSSSSEAVGHPIRSSSSEAVGHAIELVGASESWLRRARGERIALIFQEPMTRLNPLLRVSEHFVEAIRAHRPDTSKRDARRMGRAALAQMGIPPTRADSYPHEFSGGMRQRIMIALGIVMHPALVVADEPTTALDVIVEAQILDLLGRLRRDERLGLVLITHNLGIVAETCDRVAVMYAGKIVEIGSVEQVFHEPKHPYTQGLLASTISLETTRLHSIAGYPPDLIDPPPGCRFAPRCPFVMRHCTDAVPGYAEPAPGQRVACYLYPGAGAPVPAGADRA